MASEAGGPARARQRAAKKVEAGVGGWVVGYMGAQGPPLAGVCGQPGPRYSVSAHSWEWRALRPH